MNIYQLITYDELVVQPKQDTTHVRH